MPSQTKIPAGDTFSVYYGEFGVSPVPVELSFNYCSHKCAYCFANLNKPDRRASIQATMNLIASYQDRATLTAHLLSEGYPTLISNRVDPFAVSNDRQAIPVMEQMASLGMPIAIQTRGGRSVDEVLKFLPPSCWYVSIGTLDDEVRKRVEPGAPSIGSRLDLIAKLRERGHRVKAAANPLVAEWQPDPVPLMERLRDAGAEGVWIEQLHLSDRQSSRLTEREREAIGEDLIAVARKRCAGRDDTHMTAARVAAADLGMDVFSMGQVTPSRYFDAYHETYPKTFPTMQDWVNHCFKTKPRGGIVTLTEYLEFWTPRLPAGHWPVHHYLGASSKDVLRDSPMPSKATYADLLRKGWEDWRCSFNLPRRTAFAYAGVRHPNGGWIGVTDDDGFMLTVFDPAGDINEWFVDIEANDKAET